MSLQPDTKDWTWVLQRPCPDCGLDCSAIGAVAVADELVASTRGWHEVLGQGSCQDRPSPQTWSPLEYGAHVRDVIRLGNVRLGLMLAEDDPLFDNWDQDETAVRERYREQHPSVVATQIELAAAELAHRFAGLAPAQWQRTGRRSDGANFTVETFARYLLHDLVHHQFDVAQR